jgi:hypothetical protein
VPYKEDEDASAFQNTTFLFRFRLPPNQSQSVFLRNAYSYQFGVMNRRLLHKREFYGAGLTVNSTDSLRKLLFQRTSSCVSTRRTASIGLEIPPDVGRVETGNTMMTGRFVIFCKERYVGTVLLLGSVSIVSHYWLVRTFLAGR